MELDKNRWSYPWNSNQKSSGGSRIFLRWGSQLPNWCYFRPQRSCGKVMFSQACVKNSVHGGRGLSQHALGSRGGVSQHALGQGGRYPSMHWAWDVCGRPPLGQTHTHTTPWTNTPFWADTHTPGRNTPMGRQPPLPRLPLQRAADSTHPTGMHSCFAHFLPKAA